MLRVYHTLQQKKYLHIEIRHFTAYIRSDFPGERTALYEFVKISRGGAISHRSRRRSSLENSTVWSVESPVEMATTSTRLLPRKPHRGFFPCRIVRQVLRVALAAFSAAPWQGFEKAERCPSLASLFPPQAAVGSAAVRIHPCIPFFKVDKTETPVPIGYRSSWWARVDFASRAAKNSPLGCFCAVFCDSAAAVRIHPHS